MMKIQTVRFKLSQLLPWAERKAGGKLSVQEALDWYMNQCLQNGWRFRAACGAQVREPEIIYARDVGGRQVALMRDEVWTVIWESDEPLAGVNFLDELEAMLAGDSAKFAAAVCERLEDMGWSLDPHRDGYAWGGGAGFISGDKINLAQRILGGSPMDVAMKLTEQAVAEARR